MIAIVALGWANPCLLVGGLPTVDDRGAASAGMHAHHHHHHPDSEAELRTAPELKAPCPCGCDGAAPSGTPGARIGYAIVPAEAPAPASLELQLDRDPLGAAALSSFRAVDPVPI